MKYPSKYTDGLVTSANHIVEILMERKATKDGKKLVWKFWQQPQYKQPYNLSLIQVSALLNVYSEKAILLAIEKNKWAWSVSGPKIKQSIIEEQEKLKLLEEKKENSISETIVPNSSISGETRPSFKKSNLCNLD